MKIAHIFIFIAIAIHTSVTPYGKHEDKTAPLDLMIAIHDKQSSPTNENFYRRLLYKMLKDNPHFAKMKEVKKNRNFYLAILKDHIKKLEDKITQNKSGLFSKSTFKGTLSTALAILSGYISYCAYNLLSKGKDPLYTYNNHQWNEEMISTISGLGVSCCGCTIFAGMFFRNALRYKKRVLERLERDKKIVALLEEESINE